MGRAAARVKPDKKETKNSVPTHQNRQSRVDWKKEMIARLDEFSAKYPGYSIVIVWAPKGHDTNAKRLGTTLIQGWNYSVFGLKECGDYFQLQGDGGWKNWSYRILNHTQKVNDK